MTDETVNVIVDADDVGSVVVVPPEDELRLIEINEGTQGPVGPAGPQGPAGPGLTVADIAYVHVQGSALQTWVFTHPLSFTPNVMVVDSAGNEQEGTVRYIGQTITIAFSGAFSGTAYLS